MFPGLSYGRGGGLGQAGGTHEGKLTCLPDKDLLWWAQGSLTHGVVHAHPDLVTPVLAEIYEGEWGRGQEHRGHRASGRSPPGRLELQVGRRHNYYSSVPCDNGEETSRKP